MPFTRTRLTATAAILWAMASASSPALAGERWLEVFPTNGFSGMALISPDTYLVVHDTKAYDDPKGTRFGLVQVRPEKGIRYRALKSKKWPGPDGPANDLEAVCALEGRPNEALAAESGYSEGKRGRIFHVKLVGEKLEVLAAYPLPFLLDNGPKLRGDNFEGMSCPRHRDGGYWIILGERGGSSAYRHGYLRWGVLDLAQGKLEYTPEGKAGVELTAPESWPAGTKPRAVSDLHLDADGILWSVATVDFGDDGPFRSVVFPAAKFLGQLDHPFEIFSSKTPFWILDGMKIEALADPPRPRGPAAEGEIRPALAYATEDEHLGGVWRPLFPTVPRQ